MNQLTQTLALLLFPLVLIATPQRGDEVIVAGDTLYMYNALPLLSGIAGGEREYVTCYQSTDCGRGHFTRWMIENDSLFQVDIIKCCNEGDYVGPSVRVFAHWVTDKIFIPRGEKIRYFHEDYGWYWQYEEEIVIREGRRIRSRMLDNTASNISPFENKDTLWCYYCDYLKNNNIQLPDQPELEYMNLVRFDIDSCGNIINVNSPRSVTPYFDRISREMVAGLKKWSVYYRFGKPVRVSWTVPIKYTSIIEYCANQ